jgi:secondary thiamine-phosphate synthase enzyme
VKELSVASSQHTEFVEITARVQNAVDESGVKAGICTVYVPHTTAGVTITEHADPDVVADMIDALEQIVPWKSPQYRHAEGNTAAHVKSSMMGHSVQVIVQDGKLQLGTWQGVYLCEFDGPRRRQVFVVVQ